MKAVRLVIPLVTVLLVGCDDSSKPGKDTAFADGGSVSSAPTDYLKSAAKSQQKAVKTIDLTAINKAIEAFYVQEGRFPKTLEELEEKDFMRVIPLPPAGMKLNYDTNSGVVTLEKDLGKE
jgi:hypothetical protein